MATIEATVEQSWAAYLTADYVLQGVVRSLDAEQRERVPIALEDGGCNACQGFWPGVSFCGISIEPKVEDLADLETEDYDRIVQAAQVKAARILLGLREDCLKARAAELFNEAHGRSDH